MRRAFVNVLTELSEKDESIFLLTGDLGFSILEGFRDEFPSRFFDIGVAEANMIGIAAGLALSGNTVFVYSIIPFATMRCLEQIRNDICMQNLDVKIIGIGAGLSYGSAGPTHHSLSDIGIMCSLPNMTVISPSSPAEVGYAVKAAIGRNGPVYIRLGKGKTLQMIYSYKEFSIGKGIVLKEGTDITIISTGVIIEMAQKIANSLEKERISVRLVNMHTIKPIDKDLIIESVKKTKAIFSIEEHFVIGGLGSAISDVLAEFPQKTVFKRFGLPDSFVKEIGNRDYLLDIKGLSVSHIFSDILKIFKENA